MYLTIYHTTGEQVAQLRYNGRRIEVVSAANNKLSGNLERTINEGFDRFLGMPGRQIRLLVEPHARELMHALADFYATNFGFVSVLTAGKPKNNMVLGKNGKN